MKQAKTIDTLDANGRGGAQARRIGRAAASPLPRSSRRPAEPLQPPCLSACPSRRPSAPGSGCGVCAGLFLEVEGDSKGAWGGCAQGDEGLCLLAELQEEVGGLRSVREGDGAMELCSAASATPKPAQLEVASTGVAGPGSVFVPGGRHKGGTGRGGSGLLHGAGRGTPPHPLRYLYAILRRPWVW